MGGQESVKHEEENVLSLVHAVAEDRSRLEKSLVDIVAGQVLAVNASLSAVDATWLTVLHNTSYTFFENGVK